MAAPITHIVFAEKLFREFSLKHSKKAFMVGTSFPDIRYLGVIKREDSHPKVSGIQEVIDEQNSFIAGVKFHSLLDSKREGYIRANGVYDLIPNQSRYVSQAVKFLEDRTYYNKIDNWSGIGGYFTGIQGEELSYGVNQPEIKRWHMALQDYFVEEPNEGSLSRFVNAIGMPEGVDKEISGIVAEVSSNKAVMDVIEGMYDNLDLEGSPKEGDLPNT